MARSGKVEGERLLDARRAFPFASTVRRDLGERLLAQRFLGFADTEEVTGSNPVAPTRMGLTRALVG